MPRRVLPLPVPAILLSVVILWLPFGGVGRGTDAVLASGSGVDIMAAPKGNS